MKYYIKRIMDGSFPGSPDNDYAQVTEQEYDYISKLLIGRWRDTKEQAEL